MVIYSDKTSTGCLVVLTSVDSTTTVGRQSSTNNLLITVVTNFDCAGADLLTYEKKDITYQKQYMFLMQYLWRTEHQLYGHTFCVSSGPACLYWNVVCRRSCLQILSRLSLVYLLSEMRRNRILSKLSEPFIKHITRS